MTRPPLRWRLVAAGALLAATAPLLSGHPSTLGILEVILGSLLILGILTLRKRRGLPRKTARHLQELLHLEEPLRRPWRHRRPQRGHLLHLKFRMPRGVSMSQVREKREALEHGLNVSAQPWYENGLLHIRLGTARLPARLDYKAFYRNDPPPGELVVGLGKGRTGPLWVDLAALPHLLVGGLPGMGKSSIVRQMLVRLITSRANLELGLVDLKGGMEFGMFRQGPLLAPPAQDLGSCIAMLQAASAELDRRMELFQPTGIEKLSRWNRSYPDRRLPYIVVAIDEVAELIPGEAVGADKQERQEALGLLSRVVRIGRAVGFSVILCTQRPDRDAIPGQVKSNVASRIAFRTPDPIASRVLLGESFNEAANLPPHPGRALWQHGAALVEFQAIDLTKDEAECLVL